MTSTGIENTYVTVGIVIVAALTFLYAVLIRHVLLVWILLMVSFGFLYFGLRLIRAVERIATALEDEN